MKYISQKFTKSRNPVVDVSAGTISVSETYLLLPKHQRSIRCERDLSCATEPILQLILIYARRVLHNESDIDGDKQVHTSAEVYVNEV